jgi:hypothetical protein
VKTNLLIAAVALIDGIEQDGDGERRGVYFASPLEGPVRGGIVNDQDVGIVLRQLWGYAPENALDGPFRVISYDKNEDLCALSCSHGRSARAMA